MRFLDLDVGNISVLVTVKRNIAGPPPVYIDLRQLTVLDLRALHLFDAGVHLGA